MSELAGCREAATSDILFSSSSTLRPRNASRVQSSPVDPGLTAYNDRSILFLTS